MSKRLFFATSRHFALFLLMAAATLATPPRAQAQSFYVMVVEWEGLPEAAASALEFEIPAIARRCAPRRGLALGRRVAVVRVGLDGRALATELRSDDVSPSRAESSFQRCVEQALRERTYDRPSTQPAVIEIAFDRAARVPPELAPGGSGVRRGPRRGAESPRTQGTGLSPERVREVANQHASEIERCVAQSTSGAERLNGRVEFELTIEADGHVDALSIASSTTNNATFDRCAADAVRTWTFPAPGARVVFRYPLVVASEVTPAETPQTRDGPAAR